MSKKEEDKAEFHNTLYVYVCDYDEEEKPIFACATWPKDVDDGLVGEYKLVRVRKKTTKQVIRFK